MKDAIFLIPKASLLQEAVAIIDELNISMRNIDTQGDIYEYLLSELKTSGKNGQFRTPRHIIRMMVELVDPDLGDKVCDPACGNLRGGAAGGFDPGADRGAARRGPGRQKSHLEARGAVDRCRQPVMCQFDAR